MCQGKAAQRKQQRQRLTDGSAETESCVFWTVHMPWHCYPPAILQYTQPGFLLIQRNTLCLRPSLKHHDFPGSHVLARQKKRGEGEGGGGKSSFPLFSCCESRWALLADWLFKRTKIVLLRCLFFLTTSIVSIQWFRNFGLRAEAESFVEVLLWVDGCGVPVEHRVVRHYGYFLGQSAPSAHRRRGPRTQSRTLPAFSFPSPTLFLLLPKKRAKHNETTHSSIKHGASSEHIWFKLTPGAPLQRRKTSGAATPSLARL